MEHLRPDSDGEWLTIREAVDYHLRHTPRTRPIHRSAVYRWIRRGTVVGREQGGTLFVDRASLDLYCRGRDARQAPGRLLSDPGQGDDARARILCGDGRRLVGDRG